MMTVRQALVAASCILVVGCGVGPYHIPNVEPVVKPPPEEDIFAELGMEGEGATTGETKEEPKPEEGKPEAQPGAAEKPDDKAGEPKDKAAEPKAASEPPAAEKKPAEKKPDAKKK